MTKKFLPTLACAVALAVVAAAPTASARPAPTYKNPSREGGKLAAKYLTLLKDGNRAGLARFLSPAFLLQRADGSFADRRQYLANPAKVANFRITSVSGRQQGGVIVTRYELTTSETINGQPYENGPLPRLSVFRWNGHYWQLVAHSNFAKPTS